MLTDRYLKERQVAEITGLALEHDRRVIDAHAKKTRKGEEELGEKLASLSLTILGQRRGTGKRCIA